MRDPSHPDWPEAGERTDDPATALEWAWAYVRRAAEVAERRRAGIAPRRRLKPAIREYLEYRKAHFAENTVSSDRTALRHLETWAGDATTDRILAVWERERRAGYLYLQDFADSRLRKGYADSTLRTWFTCIAPFLEWLGSSVRVWDCTLPAEVETEVATWNDEELKRIRTAADYVDRERREPDWPPARLVVEWFLASGSREQEGFAAEWSRINRDEKTVRLVYQLHRDNSSMVPLKGKRARTALLMPEWWDFHQPADRYVLGRPSGTPCGHKSHGKLLERVLDAAQLNQKGTGFHRFRHTYAKRFIEMGGRLEELQKSLGHKSITITERDYGHFHEDVAAKLARLRIYREAPVKLA